ncbi:MAG: YabP/YqfC family sporulation protein [Clostridia bacterium]|nr:YabP/YqfC family sporulation protein [Clostridia bacterium]
MEITENKNNQKAEKTFNESQLVLKNRINLTLSGVEKVYETNENKIQLKVSNSNLLITGENLNISRLDVESGNVSVEGKINELKYLSNEGKGNIFKKLFK